MSDALTIAIAIIVAALIIADGRRSPRNGGYRPRPGGLPKAPRSNCGIKPPPSGDD